MPSVGHAQFDITGNNTQALRAIQQVREAALKQLKDLTLTPKIDGSSIASALQKVASNVKAQIALTLTPVTQAQVDAALGKIKDKSVKVGIEVQGDIAAKVAEIKAKLAEIKSVAAQVVKVDASTLTALVVQLKAQVAELNRIESALRTLRLGSGGNGGTGGGAGGGSPGNPYLAQLQSWRTELKAGTTDIAGFDAGLRTLQATLQADIAALRALGTLTQEDARKMDQMKAALAGVNGEINKNSITKLRTDLAGARTAFEQAIGAAGRFNFAGQRAATQAYEAELTRLVTQIRAVGTQAGLTQAELRALNQLQAQLASQRNAINGVFSQVGLAGNISNALKSLPQFASQLGGSLGAAFVGAQQLTGGLEALGGAAGPVGIAIGVVVAAIAALTLGLASTVKTAGAFEQTMVDIRALTQPTIEQFQALREATFDIGTPLGISAREAAGAVLSLNRAGLDAAETIGGGLKGALDLAGAAGVTAAQGGDMAVAAMTAFGKQSKDLPAIADVYANFANKTFLSAQHLQDAIAAVGPVAQQAGLDFAQFAGYMATLAQGGFKRMTDAGTSLKTMLLSLMAPADTAQKALDRLGYTTYDAQGNFKGLDVILAELGDKLKGLSEQDRNRYLKEIFGTDAIRAGTILLKKGNEAISENIKAMGLQGEAARVAQERLNSYQGQTKILRATFEQLTITVGEKLLPALTEITKGLTKFLDEVKRGGPVVGELKTYAGLLAIALIAVKREALLAGAASTWAGLAGSATGLAGVAAAAGKIVAALGGIPGILIVVTAAVAAFVTNYMAETQRIQDATDKGNNDSLAKLMGEVKRLREAGGALNIARADLLVALQAQMNADESGDTEGVKRHAARVAELRQEIVQLTRAHEQAAQYQKAAQTVVQGALKLTEDQLKKQTSTVKELRAELGKPIKLYGATEYQNALGGIIEKFKELRQKLYENVKDPKVLAPLKQALATREGQERANTATEFQSKASDAAATAERQVQRARVAAMAEGSAKILAQAGLDVADARRQAKEQAKAWADFPKEKARILAAGEAQAAGILAEANRKALEADRKAAEERQREAKRQAAEAAKKVREAQAVEKMGRQFYNLNANFGLAWSQGKVTPESLQKYQQAVAALRAEVEKLPEGQQSRFAALFGQAAELDKRGQALVSLKDQIKGVSDRVRDMTVAELEAARARWAAVPAAQALVKAIDSELPKQRATEYKSSVESLKGALAGMKDAELDARLVSEKSTDTQGKRIKLIQDEIESRRKLRDVTLLQGRLELQRGDAQAVISNYDARKAAAQGNAAELLAIEQQLGAEVLAARQRLAQVDAEQAILQAKEKFGKLIADAKAHGQSTTVLEKQLSDAIGQIRDTRNATQLANKAASDKALLDQTRTTTAELIKAENERQTGIEAVQNQQGQGRLGRYDLAQGQAGENLTERLAVEKQWGQEVVTVRQDMAQRAANAEIRAQQEKYRVLQSAQVEGSDEYKRLGVELNDWIIDRGVLLKTEQERIAWESAQARIKAEEAVKDAILKLNRDLIDGLNSRAAAEVSRQQSQTESDLQQDLRAAGDNEQAKLNVLISYQGRRIQAMRDGINARMKGETEAENRRWADLQKSSEWTAADAKLREKLTKEHQDRLTEITTQGEFDKGQKVLEIRNQTEDQAQRVQEKRAQDTVKGITKNLNDMTVEQRQQATTSLKGWLTTFQQMGVAGQAAAKVIQDALDQVAKADGDAIERAGDLADKLFPKGEDGRFVNPETVRQTLASRTAKIGKPDSREDAIAKGEGQYSAEIAALTQGIQDAQTVIDVLGKVPAEKLDAASALKLRMAQQYLPIFQEQLTTTKGIAAKAGQDAGTAFVDAQVKELAKLQTEMTKAQDSAADSALQLAEANHKLAQAEGIDDTKIYTAGLQAYRDYWKGKIAIRQTAFAQAQKDQAAAQNAFDSVERNPAATDQQRAEAQANLNLAITKTMQAQGELTQANVNYTNGQKAVLDVDKQRIDGDKALAAARAQLGNVLGKSAISYQSEMDSLDSLIEKYPKQREALEAVKAEYQRIQKIRQGGNFSDNFKLDFQIGFNGGKKKLSDTISSVAQGFGELANPMALLAMIIEKINIVGTVMEGIFSAIEEPIKALQEPFRIIGQILGSLIAANLQMLAPILQLVVNVFAALYDAIAEFIHKLTFGLYDIRRKDPNDTPSARRELANQKGDNDLKDVDRAERQGLLSKKQAEEERYRLTVDRLNRERDAEIEAANGNAGKIAEINRRYDGEILDAKLTMLDTIHQAELDAVDVQVRRGELTEKQGAEKKYALTVDYLNRQRADAIAAANGDQEKILAVNKKYDGLILDAKKEMLDKVQAAYKGITDGLLSSVVGGTKDLLMNALKSMNFGAFRQGFRQMFRQALFDAVVSAAIEGAALQGILQPAMDKLKEAFASGNSAAIDQALTGVLQAGSKAEAAIAKIFPRLATLGKRLGINAGGGGDSTLTVVGQIEKPEVKISLDALAMLADVIQNGIPPYSAAIKLHTDALRAAAGKPAISAVPEGITLSFSSAIDQFGLHEAAYQQHVAQFGTHVGAFGGYVGEFGQHVRVLAGAAQQSTPADTGGGYNPIPKR